MADKMHIYEDALDMVEEEIDKIVKKEELDDKCLEYLYKLVDISKDIETIMAMRGEYGGYSEDGYSMRGRPYYSYDDGMNGHSYRRRDSMGRYSRDYRHGGYMGNGYSREGDLRMRLEQMMNEATTDHERDAIRNALDRM